MGVSWKWTSEKDQWIKDNYSIKNKKEMCDYLKVSMQAIKKRMVQLKVRHQPPKGPRIWTDAIINAIREDVTQSPLTLVEIAKKHYINSSVLRVLMSKHHINIPKWKDRRYKENEK